MLQDLKVEDKILVVTVFIEALRDFELIFPSNNSLLKDTESHT